MTQELNERLSKVIEQRRLKEKLEYDLQSVEDELQSESARLDALSLKVAAEEGDVKSLEQSNLTSLFYAVMGHREQRLEKERQELLAAQFAYQQARHQVDFLERERSRVLEQSAALKDIELEYQALLAEKERFLQRANQPVASELVALSEQIADRNTEHRELSEAITAGNEAVASLEQVIQALKSAADWGTWDILGGGLISTAIKHSRIDEARSSIEAVQEKMSRFKRELADVQRSVDLQINIREFEVFADYFMDGLIFDWVVQSKILDALERSRQAKRSVGSVVQDLEILEQDVQNEVSYLEEKRTRLVERA